MGTDPQAEFLAQIARHKELIETANKIIEHSTALVKQSRRLLRMGHNGRENNNHRTDKRMSSENLCAKVASNSLIEKSRQAILVTEISLTKGD
jgi:GTP-sensing pleiotropic transcriptional regulator CodY